MLWDAKENRKGAVKPRPLCTPLGLFLLSAWVVGMCSGVDFCLYASVLVVERFADKGFEFLDCGVEDFIDFCLYASVLDVEFFADKGF